MPPLEAERSRQSVGVAGAWRRTLSRQRRRQDSRKPLPVCRGVWYITPEIADSSRECRLPILGLPMPGKESIVKSRDEIKEKVIQIVCDNLGVNKEQVTDSTSFTEDIGADSLDIVELVMELEEEFEITIPDEEAEKIKTVGEAIDYIVEELKKK
jgi:acyl carrier protein